MGLKKLEKFRMTSFVMHGAQGLLTFILWIMLLVLKAQKGDPPENGGAPSQANVMFAMVSSHLPAHAVQMAYRCVSVSYPYRP